MSHWYFQFIFLVHLLKNILPLKLFLSDYVTICLPTTAPKFLEMSVTKLHFFFQLYVSTAFVQYLCLHFLDFLISYRRLFHLTSVLSLEEIVYLVIKMTVPSPKSLIITSYLSLQLTFTRSNILIYKGHIRKQAFHSYYPIIRWRPERELQFPLPSKQ